jgi:hypothetical protein
MQLRSSNNTAMVAGRMIWKWDDPVVATAKSHLEFWNIGGGTSSRKLAILGTGQLVGDKYGIGTFTGTAAYNLAVDSSGNVIEVAAGGGGSDTNFAIDDLTFTGNRLHDMSTYNLTLKNSTGGTFNHVTGDYLSFVNSYSRVKSSTGSFFAEHYDSVNNINTFLSSTLSSNGQVIMQAYSGVGNSTIIAGASDGITISNSNGVVTIPNLLEFANDAAAAAGGIPVSGLYRSGSVLMIRVS